MHGLRKIQLLFEGSHEERMQESIGSMKEIYSACAWNLFIKKIFFLPSLCMYIPLHLMGSNTTWKKGLQTVSCVLFYNNDSFNFVLFWHISRSFIFANWRKCRETFHLCEEIGKRFMDVDPSRNLCISLQQQFIKPFFHLFLRDYTTDSLIVKKIWLTNKNKLNQLTIVLSNDLFKCNL